MNRLPFRQIAPCILTSAAMVTGFASILVSIHFVREGNTSLYLLSSQLIIVAMILDGLDGYLARLIDGTTAFGAELDTFVDFSAFGIAPAVLVSVATHSTGSPWVSYVLPGLIVLSGGLRLSRFRVGDPLRGQGGYIGLPITVNALWIALAVFVSEASGEGAVLLAQGASGFFFSASVLVLISLQLSTVKYPKIVKNSVVFFASIALVSLVWILDSASGVRLALALIASGIIFVLFPILRRLFTSRTG